VPALTTENVVGNLYREGKASPTTETCLCADIPQVLTVVARRVERR
jgi:hypothetical protein